MLTKAELAKRVASQDQDIARWARVTAERVARGVDDATAHALKALTDTLRNTPDGRPTLAKIRQSPSFQAALNRLDELCAVLIGMLSRARIEFYQAHWEFWAATIPAEFRNGLAGPTMGGVLRARRAVWLGMTLAQWFAGPIETAKRGLLAKLAQAGSRALNATDAQDLVRGWASQARGALSQSAAIAVNDSWGLCDRLAGRDVVKPELLHADPTLPA